jgi:hypothetical protein
MALSPALQYYFKVAAASFCIGASMELFMIKTGFYDTVVRLEAEARLESDAAGKAQER